MRRFSLFLLSGLLLATPALADQAMTPQRPIAGTRETQHQERQKQAIAAISDAVKPTPEQNPYLDAVFASFAATSTDHLDRAKLQGEDLSAALADIAGEIHHRADAFRNQAAPVKALEDHLAPDQKAALKLSYLTSFMPQHREIDMAKLAGKDLSEILGDLANALDAHAARFEKQAATIKGMEDRMSPAERLALKQGFFSGLKPQPGLLPPAPAQ